MEGLGLGLGHGRGRWALNMYSSANNITEDQNLYRCEPWVKIKIFNIGFLYFQFL